MTFGSSTTARVLSALAASALMHGALAAAMSRLHPRKLGAPQRALEVAIVEQQKPPPAPEPAKPPPPPPPKPVRLARAPKGPPPPVAMKAAPPPPVNAPPPPSVEAKQNTNAPIETGITLESTSERGSTAMGVGNTLYGTPSTTARDPASVKPYKADRYASIASVTEMPHVIGSYDVRRYYPPEARRKDFEGDVVLRILIDSDGSVVKADVVSDPGEGLGPAAVRAIHEVRFEPAKQNGVAVATSLNFTIHFTLN